MPLRACVLVSGVAFTLGCSLGGPVAATVDLAFDAGAELLPEANPDSVTLDAADASDGSETGVDAPSVEDASHPDFGGDVRPDADLDLAADPSTDSAEEAAADVAAPDWTNADPGSPCLDGKMGCDGNKRIICEDGQWTPYPPDNGGECTYGCSNGSCMECSGTIYACRGEVPVQCKDGVFVALSGPCPFGCRKDTYSNKAECMTCMMGAVRCAYDPDPIYPGRDWRVDLCADDISPIDDPEWMILHVDPADKVERRCSSCECKAWTYTPPWGPPAETVTQVGCDGVPLLDIVAEPPGCWGCSTETDVIECEFGT